MKLLRHILLPLSFILLSLWGTEKLYDLFISNNLYIKQSYILKKKIEADIIITGNCVPYTTLNPSIIEKITKSRTYNLAEYHSNISDNFLTYYLYLTNNKSPKKLVIYISPETFDSTFNTFNCFRFAPYLSNKKVKDIIKKNELNYYLVSQIPFFKYGYYNNQTHFKAIQGAKHLYTNKQDIQFRNGYLPINEKNIAYKTAYPIGYKFKWDKNEELQLIEFVKFSKSKGTKVILYESPFFLKTKLDYPNRNSIIKKIKKLSKKLKVDYIQFQDSTLKEADFFNNVTLRGKAKIKFNIDFANQLIK
jgi:hypothetical protein